MFRVKDRLAKPQTVLPVVMQIVERGTSNITLGKRKRIYMCKHNLFICSYLRIVLMSKANQIRSWRYHYSLLLVCLYTYLMLNF